MHVSHHTDSNLFIQRPLATPTPLNRSSALSVWPLKVSCIKPFFFPITFYIDGIVADGPAVSAPRRPAVQMPDEYLPPNKILFLQNLPESVSKDQLMALFSQ